jgi:hypothetical protein
MTKYDEDLENLENWLRRLKIEYDIFFNGNRKRPPDDLKSRVEKVVNRLSEASDMTFSQRFKYSTLVTRFYVYRDLWRRTMMDREGSPVFARRSGQPHATRLEPSVAPPADTMSVSVPVSGPDPVSLRALFEMLSTLSSRQAGEPLKLTYEKFSDFVSTRAVDIRQKYHCESVRFSVSLENESIRFTAKPEI